MDGMMIEATFIDIGALEDIPGAAPARSAPDPAISRCSAPGMTGSSPCATNARTRPGR